MTVGRRKMKHIKESKCRINRDWQLTGLEGEKMTPSFHSNGIKMHQTDSRFFLSINKYFLSTYFVTSARQKTGNTVANEKKKKKDSCHEGAANPKELDTWKRCWRYYERSWLRIQKEPQEGLVKSLLDGKVLRNQVV